MAEDNVKAQMRKGILEYCILAILSRGDSYAPRIIAELKAAEMIVVEGTLYPILHALEKEGRVKSFRREAENGRERKYYRITPTGLALLQDKAEEWRLFSEKVNAVVQGCTPVGA